MPLHSSAVTLQLPPCRPTKRSLQAVNLAKIKTDRSVSFNWASLNTVSEGRFPTNANLAHKIPCIDGKAAV